MASGPVTIGICAFNEERNIGGLLSEILTQQLPFPNEIIVVSDGSTDSTDSIVAGFCKKYSSVRLISHTTRMGKSEALNTLFRESKAEIIVIVSADTRLRYGSIRRMVEVFSDPSIGMCWARLIPLDDRTDLVARMGNLAFSFHHRLSVRLNYIGEMKHATGDIVTVRREAISELPLNCVNDDEYLAIQTVRKALIVKYLPEVVYGTRMPKTVLDYVKQRRRWVFGHVQIRKMLREPSTVLESTFIKKPRVATSIVVEELSAKPKELPVFLASLLVELAVGMFVLRDLACHVTHSPWEVIQSTK
jgi:cellulose synthase/poly-beta-1,6-N-acetylglucosamine synthase-like glycosyltransferase